MTLTYFHQLSTVCLQVLAQSEDKLQQLIAVEAIASSATKQTAAKSIINLGMGVLKVNVMKSRQCTCSDSVAFELIIYLEFPV